MPIMMSDALMMAHSSSPFEVRLRHRFIGNGGRNDDAVVDVNANLRGRSARVDFDDVALELIDTWAFDAGNHRAAGSVVGHEDQGPRAGRLVHEVFTMGLGMFFCAE